MRIEKEAVVNIEVRDFFLTLFSRIVLVVCREHLGFLYGCLSARPFTQKQGTAQGIASACERKKLGFSSMHIIEKTLSFPGTWPYERPPFKKERKK